MFNLMEMSIRKPTQPTVDVEIPPFEVESCLSNVLGEGKLMMQILNHLYTDQLFPRQ